VAGFLLGGAKIINTDMCTTISASSDSATHMVLVVSEVCAGRYGAGRVRD
jgi:hypothetical protein